MAALIGMSALFAGSSRALLTSIIFALETTAQANALLPLLAACTAAYFISFLFMKNTIMTEKIARRGIKTPHSYEADVLEKMTVADVMTNEGLVLSGDATIKEVREWLKKEKEDQHSYFVIAGKDESFRGIISSSSLFALHHEASQPVDALIKRRGMAIAGGESLKKAVQKMANENVDVLPVVSEENNVIGVLSYRDIVSAYRHNLNEHEENPPAISLKRQGYILLIKGKRRLTLMSRKK